LGDIGLLLEWVILQIMYILIIGYPVILGVKILLGRSFPASQGFVAKMLSYGILPGTGSIVMIVILLRI